MNKICFLFLLISSLLSSVMFGQTNHEEYIKEHAHLAVQEMIEYKIPASITLAQGILETGHGQSRLAKKANNHFGIKCKPEWKGRRIYHDDDAKGECFRKYSSVEESYRDHSLFLAKRSPYVKLFDLKLTDYKGWSYGLRKAGYATNPKYPQMLINLIEKYKLHEFDLISIEDIDNKLSELYPDNKNSREELAKTKESSLNHDYIPENELIVN